MGEIRLDAPVTGNQFLKMFWTVQRVAPVTVCWIFSSAWIRDRAWQYLTKQFKYRDNLIISEARNPHELCMKYVESHHANTGTAVS